MPRHYRTNRTDSCDYTHQAPKRPQPQTQSRIAANLRPDYAGNFGLG
jgi:hypothetical protein